MPPNAPGSLSEDAYLQVVAYVMLANGATPADEALLSSSGRLAIETAGGTAGAGNTPRVLPTPGRVGTATSPQAVLSAPEVVGDLWETPTSRTETFAGVDAFAPVSEEELRSPPPGDWLHWRGNLSSWGYSPLTQIHADNVHELELAWTWQMEEDELRGWQGPLVRNGVMFLSNPRNVIQALDAKDGTLLWEYRRVFPGDDGGINLRTLAIWEDLVFVATRDAYMVALDARNGRVRWEVRLADSSQGFTNSTGPIVADGKLIDGINGCQDRVETKCFIFALDARTGEELWRTYTIARPGEPGGDTWGELPAALRAGGDVWNGGSYDPQLGLVYFGVAQAKPWVAVSRGLTPADSALYTNSTLALDVDDGRIVWYRQHVPGESLDLDEAMDQVLVDVEGMPTLLTMGKHGILWKLDRRDGRFLGLKDSGIQNVLQVDPETGAVRYREDIMNARAGEWVSACQIGRAHV
jgi:alcohol dehydrogenase (cytochrome c)